MIGNSLPEYLFIRTSIAALRLVAPTSILYLALSVWNAAFPISPWLGVVAVAEAGFFVAFYLPRTRRLQAPPANPPPPLTKPQRQYFFEKCSSELELIQHLFKSPYPNGWFLPQGQEFQREDAIDWLLWSLFACDGKNDNLDEWAEELDGYIQVIEKKLGRKLQIGRGKGVKSIRLTFDTVKVAHRPLIWYSIVALVDAYSTIALSSLGFKHFCTPQWFQMFPPRPIFSQRAATPPNILLPYWYRPHTSNTKLPIVFIHGIGIGLYPYIPFIREIIALDPEVGILLIELPPLSMHITSSPIPPRLVILEAFNIILTSLHISRFVLASHSYGTFLSAYLLRLPISSPTTEHYRNQTRPSINPFSNTGINTNINQMLNSDADEIQLHHALASKVAHVLLIDPIPILLHLHPVAYNFLYRNPRAAAEWQLWYFASRDADVARTLHRAFFWEEGCLWKDDLVRFMHGEEADVDGYGPGDGDSENGHPRRKGARNLAVALAGKDQIVPSEAVRLYLTGEPEQTARWVGRARCSSSSAFTHQFGFDKVDERGGSEEGREKLEVLFYPELDHATVFDTRERRRPLLDILARFVSD